MRHPIMPLVPVSWGELLDKITILEIKHARITSTEARANITNEHSRLRAIAGEVLGQAQVQPLVLALGQVNEALWDIENAIRAQDADAQFGAEFVRLARSVYQRNDERAAIKRRINGLLGSELIEEKSYLGDGGMAIQADRKAAPAR